MSSFLDQIGQLLCCAPALVQYKLHDAEQRAKLNREFRSIKLRTTYNDRNGMRHTFFFEGLTRDGADKIPAYGRLRRPFNVSVAAHFYARHRIMLRFPQLPCVIEKHPAGNKFYPLELLVKIEEEPIRHRADTPIPNFWLPHLSSPSTRNSSPISFTYRRRSRATSEEDMSSQESLGPSPDAHQLSVWIEGGGGEWIKESVRIQRSEIEKLYDTHAYPLHTRAL